ncbi:hypothetical protein M8J77_025795 [Diaphorina citri]|jgi:Exonuclease III|nr:hypothetical protein M8J77_025795 [Diaphorina citri]
MCKENNFDILCLQETHRGDASHRPCIDGMILVTERPHDQYGSAIFAKPNLPIKSTAITCDNDVEILTVELESCSISSVYKPPNNAFNFAEPNNKNQRLKILIGDFNCHSTSWGYRQTNDDGEKLESWVEEMGLQLTHDSKLPHAFSSARWKQGYNPDNLFVSEELAQQATKNVEHSIPITQHRPITCNITAVVTPQEVPFKRRFNFRKAKWKDFTKELDNEVQKLKPEINQNMITL